MKQTDPSEIEALREHARSIGAKGRISTMNVPQLKATIARATARCEAQIESR